MSYIYDLTDTWNAAGTVFTAIKMNVTDSASASGSKLIDLQLAGTSFFNVDKSGNVGINTASPAFKLDVVASGTVAARVRNSSSNADAYLQAQNTTGTGLFGVNATGQYMYTASSIPILFYTTAAERMRITPTGSVGIGISSPLNTLQINDTSAVQGRYGLRISQAGWTSAAAELVIDTISTKMDLNTTNGTYPLSFSVATIERMRITSAGDVGIGTSSPAAKLHVDAGSSGEYFRGAGNSGPTRPLSIIASTTTNAGDTHTLYASGSTGVLAFGTGASERMRLDSSGNLGVGTTTPSPYKLNVNRGSQGAIAQFTDGVSSTFLITTASGVLSAGQANNLPLAIVTNNTERMRITAAGDVGIGTSSPTAKLDVNGQLNVPDQLAYDFTTSVLPDIAPTLNLNFVGANAVDPRITFTRSTTATYYDADTTAKAEENLLTYSQEFNNGVWSKGNTNVTADSTTAPDGTLTADTLTAGSGAGAGQQVYQALTTIGAGSFVYSVYAKQGSGATDLNSFGVYNNTTATSYVAITVNYSTGVVTQTVGSGATMTDVGGGWWRIVMPFTSTATLGNSIRFFVSGSGAVDTPGEFMYAWGAQLEQRSVVTAYTATTASAITNYIPQLMTAAINQPRLDFDPVTRAPKGFLIEEARTNSLTYSEAFDLGPWLKGAGYNCVISPNTLVAPDGTVTADAVVADTAGGTGNVILGRTVSVTSGTSYTLSFFAKAGTLSWLRLFALGYTTPGNGGAYFNLGAGTIGTVDSGYTATMTSVGNGWYRCTLSFTAGVTATGELRFWLANSDGNVAVARNGISSVYGWGAQLEAASFATSYIPTVATTVARGVDAASMTGTNFSSWYRPDEGTFAFEVMGAAGLRGGSQGLFSVNDGTTSNVMNAARTNTRVMRFNGTGTPAGDISSVGTVADSANSKVIFAYKLNDWGLSLNGAATVTDTSAAVPAVTRFGIGSLDGLFDGSAQWGGHIRSVRFYPTRLSNATLQALTA